MLEIVKSTCSSDIESEDLGRISEYVMSVSLGSRTLLLAQRSLVSHIVQLDYFCDKQIVTESDIFRNTVLTVSIVPTPRNIFMPE